MTSPEQLLQQAADDGSFDSAEWPRTLEHILARLDEIINEFPRPAINPVEREPPSRLNNILSSQESSGDKENAPPATPPRPPIPTFTGTPSASPESHSFPPETLASYNSIRSTLSRNFAKNPPHTIQRLAELILQPKQRYQFLPSYLRALDRVVSVSSPTTIFPLPQAQLPNAGGLLNGLTTVPPSTLGSDESLGGALLTPIPWLRAAASQSELISESTEMVDGPNGAGRIETVTVMSGPGGTAPMLVTTSNQIISPHPEGESLPSTGPVSQGEILRQEQEAGIVLSNPHSMQTRRSAHLAEASEAAGTAGIILDTVEDEEIPHARGPELVGVEDMGPQPVGTGHLDIEGAVGRPSIDRSSKSPGPVGGSEAVDANDAEMDDGDGEEGKAEEGRDDDMTTGD
ncbi:hypothetical protein P154DRAFT_523954 [Amniculicola lignicola CBS 123094]|uniref:PPP4R2-domain-containing protein n=1 Tax=Amniculicola lignicola CBS 123094 TaxID=1392246 RepID=A0A6A5W9U1_9PLEO|nr:hypothetical protein P154DRAFT_523954 [Amniculicola lignicola CBS 123094]